MRKLLVTAAVLLLVVVTLAIVLAVSLNRLIAANRDRLLSLATEQVGRPIRAGELSVDFRRGVGIQVRDLSVADEAAFGEEPFLAATEVLVRVRLWPLLSGDVELDAVDLSDARLRLVRNAKGVWNFTTLPALASKRSVPSAWLEPPSSSPVSQGWLPAALAADTPPEPAGVRWRIDRVTLRAAAVEIVDATRRPATTALVAPIDATFTSLSMETPVRFDANARLQAPPLAVSATGALGPLSATPIALHLQGQAGPFGPEEVTVVVEQLRGNIHEAAFSLESLEGRTCDGSFSASGTIPLAEGGTARVRGQFQGVEIRQGLSVASSAYERVEGRARGSFELESTGSLLDTAKGTVVVDVDDGALHSFNILDEVLRHVAPLPGLAETIRANLKPKYAGLFASDSTAFDILHGSFRIGEKRVRTDDLTVKADYFTAQAAGTIDFERRADLVGNLVLDRELTDDLVEDVHEVKYLTNQRGEVSLPFRLRGPLDEAKPRPDSDQIADLLARAVRRGAAQDLLEGLFGQEEQEPGKKRKRRNRIDERLRDLLGR